MIIAIHGKAGHGKDTVGKMISNIRRSKDEECLKGSFAHKVKQCASIITGIGLTCTDKDSYSSPVYDYTREDKQKLIPHLGMTLREFLQRFATEACRDNISQGIWVDSLLEQIKNHPRTTNVIITDLRFENEIKKLREERVVLVKVIRDNYQGDPKAEKEHLSEKGLSDDLFDLVITNNGTLDDLRRKVEIYFNY